MKTSKLIEEMLGEENMSEALSLDAIDRLRAKFGDKWQDLVDLITMPEDKFQEFVRSLRIYSLSGAPTKIGGSPYDVPKLGSLAGSPTKIGGSLYDAPKLGSLAGSE